MRIACLISICAYLSSTVSTDEIKFSDRIRKVRPREDLAPKGTNGWKEATPITADVYSDVHGALLRSRPRLRVETFQNPKKSHELGFQQHHYYSRGGYPTRRALKRLTTRSIAGASYELDDNQLDELAVAEPIPEIHHEDSVRIEPVLRVTTRRNVFDSIVDILQQLLNPSKNEPGPLVGPIQMPGSARKIYVRLLEPVDASHVMVRFVTQVPVPTVDVEARNHGPGAHLPPVIDPALLMLTGGHHGPRHHSPLQGDAIFDASNHHNSIQSPRNASRADKARGPQSSKSLLKPSKSHVKDHQDINASVKAELPPDKGSVSSGTENNERPVDNARLNPQSDKDSPSQFVGESIDSYYRYQTISGEENKAKPTKESVNGTNSIGVGTKESFPTSWYQLSTHRLPLRQIAPLYPLTSAMHGEPGDSDVNTYDKTLDSDVLVVPSLYETSSYERYKDAGDTASELPVDSYSQHHAGASISYPPIYDDGRKGNPSPSAHSIGYLGQNEFNGGASSSSYSISYQKQNVFDASGPYSTGYGKPSDLFGAPSSHASSYGKPGDVAPVIRASTHDERNDQVAKVASPSSNDALRVIDPPYFLLPAPSSPHGQPSISHVEPGTIRQPRYNSHPLFNDVNSSIRQPADESSLDQTTWGKMKGERNPESNLRQDANSHDDSIRQKWQPILYVDEKPVWQGDEADRSIADPTKIDVGGRRETKEAYNRSRKAVSRDPTNSIAEGGDRRQNTGKRRDAVARAVSCSTSDSESKRCEERVRPTGESTTFRAIVDQQKIQSSESNIQRIVNAATTATATASSILRTAEATTKSPNIMMNMKEEPLPLLLPLTQTTESPARSGATERSSIKMTKSIAMADDTIEIPIPKETKATGGRKMTRVMPINSTTDSSVTESTMRRTAMPGDNARKSPVLAKRPMVMRKTELVIKRIKSGDETRDATIAVTQKPLTSSSTTKRTATRQSTLRGSNSRKKSST